MKYEGILLHIDSIDYLLSSLGETPLGDVVREIKHIRREVEDLRDTVGEALEEATMKRTESTGLPTILDSEAGQKSNLHFIELTKRYDKRRVLVYPESIVAVADNGEDGCTVFFSVPQLEVTESYDEVRRLIEEAMR